jgi:small subunit ribosomal protein S1
MVDRNIVNKLGLSQQQLDQQVSEMFSEKENEFLEEVLQAKVDLRLPGTILKGTIVSQIGNDVIIEVGLKSEGVVDAIEFDDPDEIERGKEIEVLLEDTDSEGGFVLLSKRKADRIKGWETIINTKKEGDVVTGKVIRRIKGGLLVDIGVPVFLPASQVDIRKPGDISRFISKQVQCKILKIDVEGKNIVISRRKLIEEERHSSKEKLLAEIDVGQLRKGIVKNIADFGVFVDLGGLDGLLHISDLSWGRISHPSEIVKLDEEIECFVIGVDKDSEKISLGLKQKTSSPWKSVEENYPIGARVKGKVVNVMNYGVFVRLEDGIEGLVHISEMSWTKHLSHPSELLNVGDEIDIAVLNVNKEKQEISLGLKQTEINPWTIASQKYPPGTIVTAKVRSVTNFGIFVEIEEGIDGMIHISDLSWTKKYNHPSEVAQKGGDIKCVVLDVNEEKQRISLGIKQMTEDPWAHAIPEKYIPGQIIKGKVTKLTNFGVFVELETDLEGLLHISELADHKIDKPQDVVNVGDEIQVKILKVDTEARKIGLSLRRARWAAEEQEAEAAQQRAAEDKTALSDSDTDIEKTEKQKEQDKEDKEPETTEAETAEIPEETEETEQAEKPEESKEAENKETGDEDTDTQASPVETPHETDEPEQAEQTKESAEAENKEAIDEDIEKKAESDTDN